MIGILDYGMGNIKSVMNAVEGNGYDCKVVASIDDFDVIDHLIIPGVGSYSEAMANLTKTGLLNRLVEVIEEGLPTLGICLGMQILSTLGYEPVKTNGLDFIPGDVVAFDENRILVPHVGWNSLYHKKDHPIFSGIKAHVDFYFVHSFHYEVKNINHILTTTSYGSEFVSIIARDNIVGIQFHPEKSQDNGLKLLENFCDWDGKC